VTELDHRASITVKPIGIVKGGRTDPVDDHWEGVESTIVIDERFPPEVVDGLAEFSHLDVIYHFHRVNDEDITVGARHPRGNPQWTKVGIFAQRAKARPNRLGVSTCRILNVDSLRITVADLDAIDGTPVLDIKPHLIEMGPRGDVHEPAWVADLMEHYWQ
jgi:tRNA-Thr(GGU) m(6)t(6)A37 methyltransferase TsaA